MNSILKGLLIFIGGVAVGGGATYFVVNSINEEKKDKEIARLNKELDKLNRLFVVKAYKKLRKVKRKIFNSKK